MYAIIEACGRQYKVQEGEAVYFEKLENTKIINFKGWNLFFKLYKYETFSYKMQNFIILNIPALGIVLFKIKKLIKNAFFPLIKYLF